MCFYHGTQSKRHLSLARPAFYTKGTSSATTWPGRQKSEGYLHFDNDDVEGLRFGVLSLDPINPINPINPMSPINPINPIKPINPNGLRHRVEAKPSKPPPLLSEFMPPTKAKAFSRGLGFRV